MENSSRRGKISQAASTVDFILEIIRGKQKMSPSTTRSHQRTETSCIARRRLLSNYVQYHQTPTKIVILQAMAKEARRSTNNSFNSTKYHQIPINRRWCRLLQRCQRTPSVMQNKKYLAWSSLSSITMWKYWEKEEKSQHADITWKTPWDQE